jgi:hypothetical protein
MAQPRNVLSPWQLLTLLLLSASAIWLVRRIDSARSPPAETPKQHDVESPPMRALRLLVQQRGEPSNETRPPCNQEMSESFTRDQILQVHQFYLNVLLQGNADFIQTEMSTLGATQKFGAKIYKLCSSCRDLEERLKVAPSSLYPPACNASVYGYDAQHSMVVMVPTDDETGRIVSGHRHRGLLRMHANFGAYEVPTLLWPADGVQGWLNTVLRDPTNETLVRDFAASVATFIVAMSAASAGMVSIMPDYLGYGESMRTHNRTVGHIPHYQQAAAVSWRWTQLWLQNVTKGCTVLEDVATVNGFSEGGFGSVASASMFDEMGVRVLKLFVNAPFLDMESQTVFMVKYFEEGLVDIAKNSFGFRAGLPFGLFAMSADTPGLANTGTGQKALNSDWMVPGNFSRNVIDWMQSPNPLSSRELYEIAPSDALSLMNPDFLGLIRQSSAANLTSPCRSAFVRAGITDKLCEAVLASQVRTLLENAAYPLGLCYSADDSFVDPKQFTRDLFANPYVTKMGGPLGSEVTGDHVAAGFSCGHNTIEYVAGRDRPESPDDQPFYMTPLERENSTMHCFAVDDAASPSAAPGDSPSTDALTPSSSSTSMRTLLRFGRPYTAASVTPKHESAYEIASFRTSLLGAPIVLALSFAA